MGSRCVPLTLPLSDPRRRRTENHSLTPHEPLFARPPAGSYDYKALPLAGAHESFDPKIVAAGCYDPAKREWVSYDTVESARAKGASSSLSPSFPAAELAAHAPPSSFCTPAAEFISVNHLGGAMYWELSGDRPAASGASLVRVVRERIERTHEGMDSRENWLAYPGSKWENLRGGMSG